MRKTLLTAVPVTANYGFSQDIPYTKSGKIIACYNLMMLSIDPDTNTVIIGDNSDGDFRVRTQNVSTRNTHG